MPSVKAHYVPLSVHSDSVDEGRQAALALRLGGHIVTGRDHTLVTDVDIVIVNATVITEGGPVRPVLPGPGVTTVIVIATMTGIEVIEEAETGIGIETGIVGVGGIGRGIENETGTVVGMIETVVGMIETVAGMTATVAGMIEIVDGIITTTTAAEDARHPLLHLPEAKADLSMLLLKKPKHMLKRVYGRTECIVGI